MKTLVTLIMLCVWLNVSAQAPQKMSFQAVIRDAGGDLVTNKVVGMRITILQGALPGTNLYQETQTPTTNENGLVTIEIGGGTGFDAINWGNGIHFIKTETDPEGGTNYTISGTSQLLSVPYALYAKKVQIGDNWGSQFAWTDGATLEGSGTWTEPLGIAKLIADDPGGQPVSPKLDQKNEQHVHQSEHTIPGYRLQMM